jgi:hypothetical protein
MRRKPLLLVVVITLALCLASLFNLPWATPSVSGQTVPTRVKSPTPGPSSNTPTPPIINPPGTRDCRLQSPAVNTLAPRQIEDLFDIFLSLV